MTQQLQNCVFIFPSGVAVMNKYIKLFSYDVGFKKKFHFQWNGKYQNIHKKLRQKKKAKRKSFTECFHHDIFMGCKIWVWVIFLKKMPWKKYDKPWIENLH